MGTLWTVSPLLRMFRAGLQGRLQAKLALLVLQLLLSPDMVVGKQRMYQGVDISKHVPTTVLPPGSMVDVIDVHYR